MLHGAMQSKSDLRADLAWKRMPGCLLLATLLVCLLMASTFVRSDVRLGESYAIWDCSGCPESGLCRSHV